MNDWYDDTQDFVNLQTRIKAIGCTQVFAVKG